MEFERLDGVAMAPISRVHRSQWSTNMARNFGTLVHIYSLLKVAAKLDKAVTQRQLHAFAVLLYCFILQGGRSYKCEEVIN